MVNVVQIFLNGECIPNTVTYGKEYDDANIVYVLKSSPGVCTEVDMVLAVCRLDVEHKTFSLLFKKVPLEAVAAVGDDAYVQYSQYVFRMRSGISSWTGVMGNGATQVKFTMSFQDGAFAVSVDGSPAFQPAPFVSEFLE